MEIQLRQLHLLFYCVSFEVFLVQLGFYSAAIDLLYICISFAEQCLNAEELFLPQRRQRKSEKGSSLPQAEQLPCDHIACEGELSSPGS